MDTTTITFEWNDPPSVNDQMNLANTFNMLSQIQIADSNGKLVPLLRVDTSFTEIGGHLDDVAKEDPNCIVDVRAALKTSGIDRFGYYFYANGTCNYYHSRGKEPWAGGILAVLKHIGARVVYRNRTRIKAILN